jgi:hypothetical protein
MRPYLGGTCLSACLFVFQNSEAPCVKLSLRQRLSFGVPASYAFHVVMEEEVSCSEFTHASFTRVSPPLIHTYFKGAPPDRQLVAATPTCLQKMRAKKPASASASASATLRVGVQTRVRETLIDYCDLLESACRCFPRIGTPDPSACMDQRWRRKER